MSPLSRLFAAAALWLLSSLAGAQVTYVHTDLLGSPVMETDAVATVVREVEHRSFGLEALGKPKPGPGFTGHYRDTVTDLIYMQQRYYDPVAMRFVSADPVGVDQASGGNFNRYWYANNNPYRYTDPDGTEIAYAFRGGARISDGVKTLAYLMRSPTARGELGQIHQSKETYLLSFEKGSQADARYEHDTRTVTINPEIGLRVGNSGEIQSAALGAGHEITHAAEHDRIGTESFVENLEAPLLDFNVAPSGAISVSYGTSPEEQRATNVEGNMARELGEPVRSSYSQEQGTVKTCSPTGRVSC